MKDEIIKARKQNMKIYTIYRSISIDLIFYYAIDFLFLTQVKNISASDIVLADSFFAIFMIIFQIPASIIIDKLGTKKCTTISNLFNTIFIILILNCTNLSTLIFAQLISSFCYSLKWISDKALLRYSIPESKNKDEIYSKLDGRSYKNYYIINAITSVLSGFLYVVNPYIPMIVSLIFTIISTIISLGFKDIENVKNVYQEHKTTKKYFKELKEGMQFILNSQRLRSLFIYGGLVWGIFMLMGTYRSSVLVDIGTPAQAITTIIAILGIASSIGSGKQLEFNRKFKNKSLSIILALLTSSILIAGISVILKFPYYITLLILTICLILTFFTKGMNTVLTNRYLTNFSNEKVLTQILAVNEIVRNIFRAAIGFVGAYLLNITSTANAMILVGIFLLISSIGLISYMKTRLGLKPKEYDENEIFNK